jgi:phosphoribosylanthranilate isomerase
LNQGSVKICSLRAAAHADWVIDAGADAFGLIFAPARRRVSIEQATDIVREARSRASGSLDAVGVFVDADVAEINNIAAAVNLGLAQLHGDEPPEHVGQIAVPVIKAIRPLPAESFDDIARRVDAFESAAHKPIAYLMEGFASRQAGGNGVLADWGMARRLAERFPMVLAGGLTPENVAEAIESVRPIGVDVSSGVETDGVKDRQKMMDFVSNARAAFERIG